MKDRFSNYPNTIKASTQHAEHLYVLQTGIYAVHGEAPPRCKERVLFTVEEGKIVICKGNPDELPPSVNRNTITPVYSLEPSGLLAVPTGLILVRFADNIRAANQKDAVQRIGYIIDQELPYAPQAIWVKPANGDIAFALHNAAMLEAQPHVENVEPQMLMESVRRGSNSRPL